MDNKEPLYVACECGSHLLQIEKDEEDDTTYLAIFTHGNPIMSWRMRLITALKILRTGKNFADQLVLTPQEVKKLKEYL